jgi:hypothetical protein
VQRQPWTNQGEQTPHVEGVIHRSGQEIVPCAFKLIERGFTDSPPRYFPGKLLAFTEGQPRILTPGQAAGQPRIWCPLPAGPKRAAGVCGRTP